MPQTAIQGPTQVKNIKTGQTINLPVGTHYLSEDWQSIGGTSTQTPINQSTVPGATSADQQNNAIASAFQSIKGRSPSQEELNRFQGYYPDMGSLQNAIQAYSPQQAAAPSGSFSDINALADLVAQSGKTMDQLRQEFLNSAVGQEFQATAQKTKQSLEKQYGIQNQQMDYQKRALEEDYQRYLDDTNEGRIQSGSTYDRERLANLEQRNIGLQQQQMQLAQNLDTVNRGFIARGGLFSGPREQKVQQTQTAADLARQAYEQIYGLGQQRLTDTYNQQMQDYRKDQQAAELNRARGVETLGYQGQLQQLGQEQGLANLSGQQIATQEELLQKKYNQQWY